MKTTFIIFIKRLLLVYPISLLVSTFCVTLLMALLTDIPSVNFENIYEIAKGVAIYAMPPAIMIASAWTRSIRHRALV
jgi:hypothetical protein